MDVLREGASGPDGEELQRKLQESGFAADAIDGEFGPGTEAAVLAFQQSRGLLTNGVVGPRTAAMLGFTEGNVPPSSQMLAFTVAMVSKMFPATPLSPHQQQSRSHTGGAQGTQLDLCDDSARRSGDNPCRN